MPENELILVLSTCHSETTANRIASGLVQQKLAACVNIIPGIESVYHWQDKIQRDKEYLLIIKSRKELFPQLQDAITELHDYELPEIIAVPIEAGEQAYLNWIKSATLVTDI
jgi:periplasmic divalent cation tolerance protein